MPKGNGARSVGTISAALDGDIDPRPVPTDTSTMSPDQTQSATPRSVITTSSEDVNPISVPSNTAIQLASNTASQLKKLTKDPLKRAPAKDEEMVSLTLKVPRRYRQHWVAEARRRGLTIADVIAEHLQHRFGLPEKPKT